MDSAALNLDIPFALKLVMAFGLSVIADWIWSRWMMAVHAGSPLGAGLWSSSIMLAASVNLLLIVHDLWLIPAEVVGAFLGAYWAVKSKNKNAPNVT